MKQRELERAGSNLDEAAVEARRGLGSIALAQDRSRDVWQPQWAQGLLKDLRLGVRSLIATPLVTIVALLSISLGIGANTAIFSILDSLLLRTLPVREANRLVLLGTVVWPDATFWSYPVWQELHARADTFDGMMAWSVVRFDLSAGGETQFVDGLWVNGTYFDELGVQPFLGRFFSAEDDRRDTSGPIAVIGYSFWQQHYGGTPDVIGRTISLDRLAFTIIGVAPPGFFGTDVGRSFDVAVPFGDEPLLHGRDSWQAPRSTATPLSIMMRLKPGQTRDGATAILRGIQPNIREATLPGSWPQAFLNKYLKDAFQLTAAATGHSGLRRRFERPLVILMLMVAAVLMIACTNVANLLLARGAARHHELAVRRALGASRWRLVRQLFAESALLATCGAVFGVVIASSISRFFVQQLSSDVIENGPSETTGRVFLDLSLNTRVLAFTVAATVVIALVCGVIPALRGSRVGPIGSMKEHGPGLMGPRSGTVSSLVVVQVALSLVLVFAAGLFARTFVALTTRPLGFDRTRVVVVNVDASRADVDPAQRVNLYERVRQAVLPVPGVIDAAISKVPPIVIGPTLGSPISEVSGAAPLPPTGALAGSNIVSPGWFKTVRTPIIAGRAITERDQVDTPPVVLVNQAFERRFLSGQSALGHTVTLRLPGSPPPPYEIVGVVADAVYDRSLRAPVTPMIFLPLAQRGTVWLPFLASMSLNVRVQGDPAGLVTHSILTAIAEVNPKLALTSRPLTAYVNASLTQERLVTLIGSSFAVLALLLAALGLYGISSYAVSRRRTELGIRIALGAWPLAIVRLVLTRSAVLVGTGVVLGTALSLWASRFISTLIYGLSPRDPITLAAAALLLLGVAAISGGLPAWRASHTDPASVLRCE